MENAAHDKTPEAILAGTGISFLLFAAFFGLLFYDQKISYPNVVQNIPQNPYTYAIKSKEMPKTKQVLSSEIEDNPPSSYTIPFDARKQVFNLSCEFAAASSIIYHFTKNPAFSKLNEKAAEKTLMEKIGVSQNPNIGVRMAASDSATLFENLNNKFGGSEYYGVHAPPFLALFAAYGLVAEPMKRGEDKIKAIQRFVSLGRPVMAWIQIGRGNPIDVLLSYDTTPIVRGEHVVIVYGYNENGVFVMDPGTGGFRHIPYSEFLTASSSFRMPFLSVYQGVSPDTTAPESVGVDLITGLDRGKLRIAVLNGSGKEADAEELIEILRDFGYTIVDTGNADSASYENVTLFYNSKIQDYIALLQKDLRLSMYNVSSVSAALDNDEKKDVVLIVGK